MRTAERKFCGVANVQKSSIHIKVKPFKVKVPYLTAYDEDDVIIIIIVITIILQIYCNNDFKGKYFTVVGPKLSGTPEDVSYRWTILYKKIFYLL
jgi:hypothetical protein